MTLAAAGQPAELLVEMNLVVPAQPLTIGRGVRSHVQEHHLLARPFAPDDSPEIDALLVKLGNRAKAIPFYALYPAGQPDKPIVLDGVFGPDRILKALAQAVGKSSSPESVTVPTESGESGGG